MDCSSQNEKNIYSLFRKAPNGSIAKSPISGTSGSTSNIQNLSACIKKSPKPRRKGRKLFEEVKPKQESNLPNAFGRICQEVFENRISAHDLHNFETENRTTSFHRNSDPEKVSSDHAVNQSDLFILKEYGSRNISAREGFLSVDSAQKGVETRQLTTGRQVAVSSSQKLSPKIKCKLLIQCNLKHKSSSPSFSGKDDGEFEGKPTTSTEINRQPIKIPKLSSFPLTRINSTSEELKSQHLRKTMKVESKIIKINYNNSIVEKLEQILNGPVLRNVIQTQVSSALTENSKSAYVKAPDQIIHPLLLKKPIKQIKKPAPVPKKKEISSPLREPEKNCTGNIPGVYERSKQISQSSSLSLNRPKPSLQYVSKATTLRRQDISTEVSEAAWPWKGIVHVRGLSEAEKSMNVDMRAGIFSQNRQIKSKKKTVEIALNESIISSILNSLDTRFKTKIIQESNADELHPLPNSIRLPVKHFESGFHVQHRLQGQVLFRGRPPNLIDSNSSEDEIQCCDKRLKVPFHPALETAYASIASNLSSIDKGQSESQVWAQKHAPNKVENVLQTGPEAFVLKEWLLSLTVSSTGAGLTSSNNSPNLKPEVSYKRRRKSAKKKNFIIPDDEDNELHEIKISEEGASTEPKHNVKRTELRCGKWSKNKNHASKAYHTILISGPNGCGKSAAVYAAAKELNFEVFEINSSCRRSGKDIMDKIGDMISNHHVQNGTKTPGWNEGEEDKRGFNVSLDNELESGRQGILNLISISKKNKVTARQSSLNPSKLSQGQVTSCKEPRKVDTDSSVSSKEQKQSLILIEEADVIFKEDSQFWSTVENVIAISKRPIVITCNDESAIPLSDSLFHAILRFQPPPIDLAVDYMLMVAACEGHVIQRDAVKALYEERKLDLRASLNELNFWCQFAVGDINKEPSWHAVQNNAHNPETDQYGHHIRVISEGTYKKGMGWISQDTLKSGLPCLTLEEELFQQTSHYWNIDIGDWYKSVNLKKWAGTVNALTNDKEKQLAALNMFSNYTESMSDSDLLSESFFGSVNQIILDPCLPKISKKTYGEYPLANKLVEASSTASYSSIARSISFYIRSRARNILQISQKFEFGSSSSSSTESRIIDLIRRHPIMSTEMLHKTTFSQAFYPISYPNVQLSWARNNFMDSSQFDRTQKIICEDLAPYVRGIVAYYIRLQRDREKMSHLIQEGCTGGKRRRTTRAAMSALEGGRRSETRPESYFGNSLNPTLVEKTGIPLWIDALVRLQKRENIDAVKHLDCASTRLEYCNHE